MIKFFDTKDNEIFGLSFGRVRLGETVSSILIARNVGKFPLIDINFAVDNADVFILSSPLNLRVGEQEEVKVEWVPKLNSEFGLKCKISWKGDELRGEE